MDLGSLEIQIFVSLTVVLGGAFVALICDYLKGNNEQLRERNIELRVRKEEQERWLLLDPAGFVGRWLYRQNADGSSEQTAAGGRPVGAHEVMQSFAAAEALAEAANRASAMQARSGAGHFEAAEIPPMTQHRGGRNRSVRNGSRNVRPRGESRGDWVRPEVIARVARQAEAASVYGSDIREDLEALPADGRPEPLNAAENWDIRAQIAPRGGKTRPAAPPPEKETPASEPVLTESNEPPREVERVSQVAAASVVPAPGTILRPLTVPSLKLEEELQRVAERVGGPGRALAAWHSPLLDEVIAASGARVDRAPTEAEAESVLEAETTEAVSVPPVAAEPADAMWFSRLVEAPASEDVALLAQRVVPVAAEPEFAAFAAMPEIETVVGERVAEADVAPLTLVATEPEFAAFVAMPELEPVVGERVAEADVAPLAPVAAEPEFAAFDTVRTIDPMVDVQAAEPDLAPLAPGRTDSILSSRDSGPLASRLAGMGIAPSAHFLENVPAVETPSVQLPLSGDWLAPLPEFLRAAAAASASVSAPPPFWLGPIAAEPIDISAARQPEFEPEIPATAAIPALLFPAGMHELSTWNRLLELPNPMTGILVVISMTPERKGAASANGNGAAIENLMASFVREGDFGARLSANEWAFIYTHDAMGSNRRRVGSISEKLWDFQLRHMGLADVNFKWGAADIESEPLGAAWEAARDRMNQTGRARSLPIAGPAAARRAVNG